MNILKLYQKVLKFLLQIVKVIKIIGQANPKLFLLSILFRIIQGIFPVISAWIMKELFDVIVYGISATNSFNSSILPLMGIYALIQFLSMATGNINRILTAEMTRQLTLFVEISTYKKLEQINGLSHFESPRFHDTLRLGSSGVLMATSEVISFCFSAVQQIITIISFLGILFLVHPILFVFMLLPTIPQLVTQLKLSRYKVLLTVSHSPKLRYLSYFKDLLINPRSSKEIKTFALSDYFISMIENSTRMLNGEQRQLELKEQKIIIGYSSISVISVNLALLIVFYQAYQGQIGIGDISLYTNAIISFLGSLSSLILSSTSVNEKLYYFNHYEDLLNLKDSISNKYPLKKIKPLRASIEFRNVSFRYSPNHPWILKNINLNMQKGKNIALIGINGAGKSTLIKLLVRLYDPFEGEILWDGIDIRHFDVTEYRKKIGIIFQDFVRYDLSIRENIGLGNISKLDNEPIIQDIARQVGIHNWIMSLPDGYDTVLSRHLGEADSNLDISLGQWQKIAIARSLIANPEFFIFDEPTSSLDAYSEHEIIKHIWNKNKNKTSLIVSHRFSTIIDVDYIFVLDEGIIIETGTHAELLKKRGLYWQLYNTQMNSQTHQLEDISILG